MQASVPAAMQANQSLNRLHACQLGADGAILQATVQVTATMQTKMFVPCKHMMVVADGTPFYMDAAQTHIQLQIQIHTHCER